MGGRRHCDEAHEVREAVEARVAPGEQDEHRRGLEQVEEDLSERVGPEDVVGLLGDDRRSALGVGHGVGEMGDERHTENEHAEDRAHHDEDPPGVDALGRAEGAHGVGHGLEARQRGAAVRERPQEDEDRGAHQEARSRVPDRNRTGDVDRVGVEVAKRSPDQPGDDHEADHRHEEVGRDGEDLACLPEAAQVGIGHEDDDGDADLHGEVPERGEGRGQRVCPGGHLHGHGQDVIDDQRRRGDLGDVRAEVLPRRRRRSRRPWCTWSRPGGRRA